MYIAALSTFLTVATAAAVPLERRQALGGSTENQFTDGTSCNATTVLFARGTTEPGNVGTLTGPPFFEALATKVGQGNLTVQGVDYPASIQGFLAGGDAGGSQTLATLIGQVQSKCPNTKLVVSGYSQGGQLVHNAAKAISASQTSFINSVVIFGDPDNGTAVGNVPASKTLVICHQGDDICAHGDEVLEPHLTYSQNAGQAADFVASQSGA